MPSCTWRCPVHLCRMLCTCSHSCESTSTFDGHTRCHFDGGPPATAISPGNGNHAVRAVHIGLNHISGWRRGQGEEVPYFGAKVLVLIALDRFLIQLDARGCLLARHVAGIAMACRAHYKSLRSEFEAEIGLSAMNAISLCCGPIGCVVLHS